MNKKILEKAKKLNLDIVRGSYTDDECIFLLKDVTEKVKPISIEEMEEMVRQGINYSETLTEEYFPKKEYNDLFLSILENTAFDMASYIAKMSEAIYNEKGNDTVIVSLARAGTPFGVLVKNYIKFKHNVNVPHYSVSIIRDKGIDENAIIYILAKHPNAKIQFIDGWTGKGSITFELQKAMKKFYEDYDVKIDDSLAVLADPAKIARICGTREDVNIANCCLNSTVSGLISRTYHSSDIIGENDFHGARKYTHLESADFSRLLLDKVRNEFKNVGQVDVKYYDCEDYGSKVIEDIAKEFNVKTKNKIKLSIGESSRVLIRRDPECLLVKNFDNPQIKHLLAMAKDRGTKIIKYDKTDYECIAIIKE